jgi:ferredoxin
MCFMACPQVFQLSDEDGHASVVAETVPDVYQDAVRQAQQSCPEQAVEIFQ